MDFTHWYISKNSNEKLSRLRSGMNKASYMIRCGINIILLISRFRYPLYWVMDSFSSPILPYLWLGHSGKKSTDVHAKKIFALSLATKTCIAN